MSLKHINLLLHDDALCLCPTCVLRKGDNHKYRNYAGRKPGVNEIDVQQKID
jgi:hypothetical protein